MRIACFFLRLLRFLVLVLVLVAELVGTRLVWLGAAGVVNSPLLGWMDPGLTSISLSVLTLRDPLFPRSLRKLQVP